MDIKKLIAKRIKLIAKPIFWYKDRKRAKYRASEIERLKEYSDSECQRIFYFGITEHPNLGDMGQFYCIQKWIDENFHDAQLIMFESSVIVDSRFTNSFINEMNRILKSDDIIILQSGYCTQDLGGPHTKMHEIICDNFSTSQILMFPQTVFFKNEVNKERISENHNKAKKMLFLARDYVSYGIAQEMFKEIRTMAFPDIVTTLIGTLKFNNVRKGVCLCTRNDGEKFYSDSEIEDLEKQLSQNDIDVFRKDTQSTLSAEYIRKNLRKCIESEIESYSNFELTITDRYHGTIFSLCAGTPVIIIKSNDHKVITGADWFRGIYDDYVYVAEDLDAALLLAKQVLEKKLTHELAPYFKEKYYDKLKSIFLRIN